MHIGFTHFRLLACLLHATKYCRSLWLMILMTCTCLYAASCDFNKLSNYARQRYGEEAFKSITELNQLISQIKQASDNEKLTQINNFFNRKMRFADDIELWNKVDYWATPLESIGIQAGDCEDFSIAKYIFLKVANVPNEKLRLTYVRAELYNQDIKSVRAHMVLSYYATPQSEPLILDNLIPDILPASARKDLYPVFSFNDKGLWVAGSTNQSASSQTSLSRWRDVLARIKADGIE